MEVKKFPYLKLGSFGNPIFPLCLSIVWLSLNFMHKDIWTRNGFVPNWIWWICSILLTCNKRKRKMNGKYDRKKKLLHPYIRCIKKYLEKVVYFSSGGFPWFSPYTLTQNSFYRRTLTLMSFIFMKSCCNLYTMVAWMIFYGFYEKIVVYRYIRLLHHKEFQPTVYKTNNGA